MHWSPDTCPFPSCVVVEQGDKDNPQTPLAFAGVVRKCSAHSLIPDAQLYGILYANPDGENKRKNLVYKQLLEGNFNLDTIDPQSGAKVFKNGVEFQWSFTDTRVLQVVILGMTLTNPQKNTLQNFCDTAFGLNKVTIL